MGVIDDFFRTFWWLFALPVVVFVLLMLAAYVFGRLLAGDGQQKKNDPPMTGVELIIGEPGSGKSFIMLRRMVDVMKIRRRPVYTNLPIKWRVFRWLLRREGGERLANLVHELTEEHMNRFMERFESLRKFRERMKRERPDVRRKEMRRLWLAEAGDDVVRVGIACKLDRVNGEAVDAANWIPPQAVIVVDEAHHWWPNASLKSVKKEESPALMSYLTMHRHAHHWVWVVTQNEVQISKRIRDLASLVCTVAKRDQDKIIWGFRFKHFRIKVLGYKWFTQETFGVKPEKPFREFMYFPKMFWNQIWFRLYHSHTHLGSAAELREGLHNARIEAGLSAAGGLVVASKGVSKMPKFRIVPRLVGFVSKVAIVGAVAVGVVALAFWMGSQKVKGESPKVVETGSAIEVSKKSAASQPAASQPVDPSRGGIVASMSPAGVRFRDGRSVQVGGRYADLELASFDVRAGVSVWNDLERGDVWLWSLGQQARRLGSVSEVNATLVAATKRRAYLKAGGRHGIREK